MNRKVVVHDKMQKGYTYEIVCEPGKQFHPDFKPDLTPKQMLALGVFGGVYMRDCVHEFPKDWFTHVKFQKDGVFTKDAKLNFFKINASQPLSVWCEKGWIYREDPRGWFQWYCRYYMGRRIPEEDTRQIKRWVAMRRHVAQIRNSCELEDFSCHTRQRQAVLHWAYDSRRM